MNRLFCFGLGYSAQALARRVRDEGWHVAGTARSDDGVQHLTEAGFQGLLFDGDTASPDLVRELSTATHVIVSVPPQHSGDPVLSAFADTLRAAPQLRWIGYLSTVGVYGNTHGEWVDEASAVHGDFDRTRWRIAAEQAWLSLKPGAGAPVQVFRLAGIYGPGRSAFDSLRSGRAQRIVKPGQVFNRIHVDDIADVLRAAMTGRGAHEIYNVADHEPAPPQDVITFAAELLDMAPPPEIAYDDARMSPMARSFYEANRRVSNARLAGDLNVRLRYPNYRDGLRAILAGEQTSPV
jgi:nucleoside-diphosphate-sugar epimerase